MRQAHYRLERNRAKLELVTHAPNYLLAQCAGFARM